MRILYLIYQWLIAVPLFIVLTFITALITIIALSVGCGEFWAYWPAHIWSRLSCLLFLIRVKVEGRENINSRTSYVFVANHQGAFDIFSIFGYLNHPFKWMMKQSLEKIFMVGYACKKSGHIFVDEANLHSIKTAIREAEDKLKDGMSLVIFPEGSRSWDGNMIPFKRGAFLLAAEFKLPVVPITINGAFDVMPRYAKNLRPGLITLTIHNPIYPDSERGFNTKVLMSQCYDEISKDLLPSKKKGKIMGD